MSEMQFEKLGPLYAEIGAEGAAITDGQPDGLYIYMEVEEGSIYSAVFRDEGKQVRYFDASDELLDLVRDVWKAQPKGKRWFVMEYEVHGRSFDVSLTYPEDVDPKSDSMDRRQAALEKRYGSKPVIYPPITDRFKEWNPTGQ